MLEKGKKDWWRKMNIKTKILDFAEITQIYTKWMCKHFPENERKPLKKIEEMWKDAQYQAVGLYDEKDTFLGYAFFVLCKNCNYILLDYFAILEKYRSTGIGSKFLGQLKKRFPFCKGIIIETEDEASASTVQEQLERKKRNAFYLRNGVQRVYIKSAIYTARYEIFVLPIEEKVSQEECFKALHEIYQYMVPGEKNQKYVRFQYIEHK